MEKMSIKLDLNHGVYLVTRNWGTQALKGEETSQAKVEEGGETSRKPARITVSKGTVEFNKALKTTQTCASSLMSTP